MRKKIRSIHIILFVMLFLVGSFIDISTIHAEAGSRIGSIQIICKGRNSSDKEVTLSGAKFSIFPIQYMKNDELIWEDDFKDSGISLQDTSAEAREKQARQLFAFAKENNISGLTQETDTSGRTSFGELSEAFTKTSGFAASTMDTSTGPKPGTSNVSTAFPVGSKSVPSVGRVLSVPAGRTNLSLMAQIYRGCKDLNEYLQKQVERKRQVQSVKGVSSQSPKKKNGFRL